LPVEGRPRDAAEALFFATPEQKTAAAESERVSESPSPAVCHPLPSTNWRRALAEAVRDPVELCRLLDLPRALVEPARRAAAQFGLFAPRGYVARMKRSDVDDPLLRQVLPLGVELDVTAGFSADPVDDAAARLAPGLLQKYAGRVLLVTTGACAIHCRYCFRRHYPYADEPKSLAAWEPALAAIAADATIEEVILSGGDPLTLVDELLEPLVRRIEAIPHVRRLRIHTRLPIVLPERVDDRLLGWLAAGRTRLTPVCVVHANHANELDGQVAAVLARLADAGVLLLNQTVLLRGVNDSVAALAGLSRRLVECRVLPYYLHQLDRVAGAAHFEVPEAEGLRLIELLQAGLPGYLVPRYVREMAGEESKTILVQASGFGVRG
jgi:EF-P beta-lysylation protein EpmB